MKTHKCHDCGRMFATENAVRDHARAKHGHEYGDVSKAARIEVLDCIADDMSDGAYFAMAEDMGIDIDDFMEDIDQ